MVTPEERPRRLWTSPRLLLALILVAGSLARLSLLAWNSPWTAHHPDEHILPLEAIASWEGVTPREVGWPASTTRLALSGIEAMRWSSEEGASAWAARGRPTEVLTGLGRWIGRQYLAPERLYRDGRMLSAVTGIVHLAITAWLLARWAGPAGWLGGTLAVALSPMVVTYSQFVLADITGLLFATLTLCASPAAGRDDGRAALAGGCAALAAASKFHFGIWLLAPLLSIWMGGGFSPRARLRSTVAIAAGFAVVFLMLFPWALTNPPLAAKEFLGVVGVKVGAAPQSAANVLRHAGDLLGSEGALLWAGALVGLAAMWRRGWRAGAPILVPTAAALFILSRSEIVFDRYGLVLVPGLAILAALGWDMVMAWRTPMAASFLVLALIGTVVRLAGEEQRVGETDVDVLVSRWLTANVPPGRRIGVHDESNVPLPRTLEQLEACGQPDPAVAYAAKWRMLGYPPPPDGIDVLRAMLLNDEIVHAYWCRRERAARSQEGYVVVRYHNDLRSNAILEREAVADFAGRGLAALDVLVANRELSLPVPPAAVLETRRGRRVIYLHAPAP